MLKKISFRDSGADLVASSIYFSSLAARTMNEVIKQFPGYNNRNSEAHARALNMMLTALDPLITSSAAAHDIDKPAIVEKLKNMLSEGMS
jgi:hypothetical protein